MKATKEKQLIPDTFIRSRSNNKTQTLYKLKEHNLQSSFNLSLLHLTWKTLETKEHFRFFLFCFYLSFVDQHLKFKQTVKKL